MEWMDPWILIVLAPILSLSAFILYRKLRASKGIQEAAPSEGMLMMKSLARTREILGPIIHLSSSEPITQKEWESIEESLLVSDIGTRTTEILMSRLKENIQKGNGKTIRSLLQAEGESLLANLEHGALWKRISERPLVISIVGVNGAGKTTTVGKLSQFFRNQKMTVLIAAADTFRAAAIDQLRVWAERTQAQFVTGREGADPGAVAFDSVNAAKARGVDVVLLDTAGRLHTKTPLMDELVKIHRVIKKVIPEAPHETWLVVDGTTGQNAIQQAREFQKRLPLSGVIVTKLDGTAKGGALLSITSELNLPIKYIGIGEAMEDLVPFEPHSFIQALLG